jgi:hypothetical protein
MTDISPPDYSSPVGLVRAHIPDVEQVDWEHDGNASYLFTDSHLTGLLSLNGVLPNEYQSWSIKRAAADAVDALAVSEALISKVIKTEDLQTDGAKVANALIQRAVQLRRAADDEEESAVADTAFTIVDYIPTRPIPRNDWNVRIATWREILR